ncbi:MAG: right-handed parallel beta-helix repeat-containing protein [Clostridia bacterium]|nr:right-handed parallel beta-helix repeat-containing protein [Clostridia bacterium]
MSFFKDITIVEKFLYSIIFLCGLSLILFIGLFTAKYFIPSASNVAENVSGIFDYGFKSIINHTILNGKSSSNPASVNHSKPPKAATINRISSTVKPTGKIYYVSNSGNDNNNGLSPKSPLKTLSKASDLELNPGDAILLKCGDTWRESIFLADSGTREHPILLSSYGEGKKPKIECDNGFGLVLYNCSGWIIQNLQIFVASNEPDILASQRSYGIKINYTKPGGFSDITIENNEIYGDNFNRPTFGIFLDTTLKMEVNKQVCQNITIRNNLVHDIGIYAIAVLGWATDKGANHASPSLHKNVQIYQNYVYNTGAHGIVLGNAFESAIKRNIVYDGGLYKGKNWTYGPVAIWCVASDGINIKFNECFRQYDSNSGVDGGGIDLDWSARNFTVQYNYCHDNYGPGIETMSNKDCKILNNRVENNLAKTLPGSAQIMLSDATAKTDPYGFVGVYNLIVKNNLIILREETSAFGTKAWNYKYWRGNIFEHNNIVIPPTLQKFNLYEINLRAKMDKIDNNNVFCFNLAGFSSIFEQTAYSTFDEWQKNTGFDKNTKYYEPDNIPPSPPKSLKAKVNQSKSSISLNWIASTDKGAGIDHYNIYRSTEQSFTPSYMNMVGESDQASFTDTEDLISNSTYYYKIQTEDKTGNVSKAISLKVIFSTFPHKKWVFFDKLIQSSTES